MIVLPPLENLKHEAFCLHYAKTGNATESYKKAGYNVKNDNTAGANARRLIQNANVKARLQEIAAEAANNKIADIREIHEILTSIARGDEYEEVVVVEGKGGGWSEARIVTKKPTPSDRTRAAVELAKMQGGYITKKSDTDKEEQRAKIDKLKAETARIKGEGTEDSKQDDGFIEALKGEVDDIWDET